MKAFFEILKELIPLWLLVISIGFGYLIFLYTRIFNKTNKLAESQADYYKDRLDSVETTIGIFEKTVKHQESVISDLTKKLEDSKELEIESYDLQIADINKSLNDIRDNQIKEEQLKKIIGEIEKTKELTIQNYDRIIEEVKHKPIKNQIIREKPIKRVFLSSGYTENYQKKLDCVQRACISNGLELLILDDLVQKGQIITESIRNAIEQSDVIIADISNDNSNVLYDLGFAHAKNKPVIIIASDLEPVKVDASNVKVILYDETTDSLENLEKQLLISLRMIKLKPNFKNWIESVRESLFLDAIPFGNILKIALKLI